MTLERINPDDLYPPFFNNYTQVIRASGSMQIHLAGMVPVNEKQELVGEGDMQAQTRAVMENIGKALAAAGATPADVVRINTYTLDVDRCRAEGYHEIKKFFGKHRPVSTLVGVTRLADPRYLVEVEATAIVD